VLLVRAREGAELALHAADVGVVEVEVVDEVDLVTAASQAPRLIGEVAQRQQVVALQQRAAVEVESLARQDLLANGVDQRTRENACQVISQWSRVVAACTIASSARRSLRSGSASSVARAASACSCTARRAS